MNKKNEQKINLDGIMYNEDGTFKPLTASHGNISYELAYLRNTYMEVEKDYFEHLLTDENIRNYFISLIDKDSETLFAYATQIQTQLNNQKIHKLYL